MGDRRRFVLNTGLESPDSPLDRLALSLSVLLSPMLLPVALSAVLLWGLGSGLSEIVFTAVLIALSFLILPLADILWQIHRGSTPSVDVPNRQARTEIFAVGIVATSCVVAVLRELGLPGGWLSHAFLVACILNLVAIMLINLVWKISVHMVGLGGAGAVLLVLTRMPGYEAASFWFWLSMGCLAVTPILGWARYRMRAHTVAQIVAGAGVGFVGYWIAMLAQLTG